MSCAAGDRWTISYQVGNGGWVTGFRLPLTFECSGEPFCDRRFKAGNCLIRSTVTDPEPRVVQSVLRGRVFEWNGHSIPSLDAKSSALPDSHRPIAWQAIESVCAASHTALTRLEPGPGWFTYPRWYLVASPDGMDDAENPCRQVGDEPSRCRGVHHEERARHESASPS